MTPIASSRGFSVEILKGVQLCYERLSQIGVSLSWKMESLYHYTNAVRKVATVEGRLLGLISSITVGMYFLDGWTWHMTCIQAISIIKTHTW